MLGGCDRLGDVAAGARPDHRDHILGVIGDREREEPLAGAPLGDPLDHLDTPAAGHVDVEQDDIGLEASAIVFTAS